MRSEHLVPGSPVVDMLSEEMIGVVDDRHTLGVDLGPHGGRSLLLRDGLVSAGSVLATDRGAPGAVH